MNEDASNVPKPNGIGAINPKALAELKLKRTLDPKAPDFAKTVSDALETPYEELFDPKFKSPVFAGLHLKENQARMETDATKIVDKTTPLKPNVGGTAAPSVGGAGGLKATVLNQNLVYRLPDWWHIIVSDLTFGVPGEFIVDAPTATSPVQGALADCWLISAMASVAWCDSRAITEKTTADDDTGNVDADKANYHFTFYKSTPSWSGSATEEKVRVDVPQSSGMYIYCRSAVPKETWPANVEKAFIPMRGGSAWPEPFAADYDKLNYGDCVWATASLTGRDPWYHAANASDAWTVINNNCSNGRTTNPLTAWTYGSASDAPTSINYGTANIVANHAYSILGTWSTGGNDYVVLRNPWGYFEATLDVESGSWPEHETWGWDHKTLPGSGVFALRKDIFSAYYAGFGGVS